MCLKTHRFPEAPWQATPEDEAFASTDDIRARAFASCLGEMKAINPTQQRLLVAGLTQANRKTPKAKAKAKGKAKAKAAPKAKASAKGKAKAKAKGKAGPKVQKKNK